jgi:DNA-binding transcriptional ArsR family regulator
MSQSPRAGFRGPQGTESTTTVTETDRVETLLGALEDADCRSILEATTDDALTASELSDSCDLPLSTAYRKLERLTEAGLLEERLRLSQSGKHTSEYVRSVEEVSVSLDGAFELTLDHAGSEDTPSSAVAGAD